MKEVLKYESKDGNFFDSSEDCKNYEGLISKVAEIMGRLKPRPDNCSFSNGEGSVEQGKTLTRECMNDILELCRGYIKDETLNSCLACTDLNPRGNIGRLINENCPPSIASAWYRFMSINSEGFEKGQPYFAS